MCHCVGDDWAGDEEFHWGWRWGCDGAEVQIQCCGSGWIREAAMGNNSNKISLTKKIWLSPCCYTIAFHSCQECPLEPAPLRCWYLLRYESLNLCLSTFPIFILKLILIHTVYLQFIYNRISTFDGMKLFLWLLVVNSNEPSSHITSMDPRWPYQCLVWSVVAYYYHNCSVT